MALLALIATSLAAHAADCADPAALVDQVEQAVLDARFDDARQAMAQVEAAFGCTGTADSQLLARTWLAEGAMAHVEGDPAGRDQAFASAARVAPETWTVAFGDELRGAWEAAAVAPAGRGQLEVEGLSSDARALLDGKPVQVPAELPAGLYLLQADPGGDPPVFTRIVLVPEDQTLVVRVEEPTAPQAGLPVDADRRQRKKWPWLVAAGGTAALAGTSALLATQQHGAMEEATDPSTLDGAYGRQKGLAWASYGLAGSSAVLLGIGLAW